MNEYPIVSIEDPFDQDDWEHYAKLTGEIGTQVQIVGDDLLVTNPKVSKILFFLIDAYCESMIFVKVCMIVVFLLNWF